MVNLKTETEMYQDFMKYLYNKKIKVKFCKLMSIPAKFEICIRKDNELTDENLKQLSFLLKIRINFIQQAVCFKIFKQKVKLTDHTIVYQYIFAVFLI